MIKTDKIDEDKLIEGLLRIAPNIKIAHHIPGRIRLKVSLSGLNSVQEIDIGKIMGSIPGILSVRINPFAMSAIIEYDQEQLPCDLWVSLGEVGNKPEMAEKVAERLQTLFSEREIW